MHPDRDWPTYRHDNHRSGRTQGPLDAPRLARQWCWRSPQPPQPAWAGPAKYDAYRAVRPLRSMRNYDPAFHVVAAGGALYFGSSVDDSVHCLDAATGLDRWTYTTDAPVRIAPTCAVGNVYFGSDDGYAYCLAAEDGALLWKSAPAPRGRRILFNGRLISPHPCRTGVLVAGGTAYFAAGMFPWEDSYLCAVDAATGRLEGPGRYVAVHAAVPMEKAGDAHREGITMEGALLASADRLFVPQGRVPPRMFDRADGTLLGSLEGGGGCFALLTDDGEILHGPGNKDGWITRSDGKTGGKTAGLEGGTAAVVSDDRIYVLSASRLSAVDRRTGQAAWTVPCAYPYSLILAGDTLFAGGRDAVAAFGADDGAGLWSHAVAGKVHGLAAAGGCLYATTDEGQIHCFAPDASAAAAPAEPLPDPEEVPEVTEPTPPGDLVLSPYLQFTGPDCAVVRWQTDQAVPTSLAYSFAGQTHAVENPRPTKAHEAALCDLRRDTVYTCTIQDPKGRAVVFECDTHFNYTPPAIPDRPDPYPEDGLRELYAKAAEHVLAASAFDRGLCLVWGCGQGRLAYELARRSRLRVVGLETDAALVAEARRALLAAGVYGARVTVHRVESLDELPLVGAMANLIVSEQMLAGGACPGASRELYRLLRPGGGMALLGQPAGAPKPLQKKELCEWLAGGSVVADVEQSADGLWARIVRPPLPDVGVWSHQYGRADNATCGGESLAGARATGDLAVQWVGRPGPRYQPDRNARKPAPLAINGRLFGQGRRRIVALDAYNGTILWSLEIPGFARFNMPRDCGNWCADEEHVFAAVKDRCWKIRAATGQVEKMLPVMPGGRAEWAWDWGCVADAGEWLLGSAVKEGSAFVGFVGHANWYDNKEGEATFKVCSDNLFAVDKESGRAGWARAGGLVINSTVTVAEGRVYFAECRHAGVMASEARRVGAPELWQDLFLVAVGAATGRTLWERPLRTAAGTVMFQLAFADGRLVLVASDVADAKYHTYAFDARDGAGLWDAHFDWMSDNHGGHMSRPAITGGKVFVRPAVLELETGRILQTRMPGGGCGSYVLSRHAAIFRSAHVTMWDFERDSATSWHRLRPGCWISTVPACGMVLSPEAGGGCSCGSWLETSIGFLPCRHSL